MVYKKKKKNEDECGGSGPSSSNSMFPDANNIEAKKKALKDLLKTMLPVLIILLLQVSRAGL